MNFEDYKKDSSHIKVKEFSKGMYELDGCDASIPKGITRFVLYDLKEQYRGITNDTIREFAVELGEVYAFIMEKYPKVSLQVVIRERMGADIVENNIPVDKRSAADFLSRFISGIYSPSKEMDYIDTATLSRSVVEDLIQRDLPVEVHGGRTYIMMDKDVKCRVIVGLTWGATQSQSFGADVFYNARRIVKFDKMSIQNTNYTYSRLRALVFIDGPSSKTLSDSSKKDLNRTSPLYYRLKGRVMNKLYAPYVAVLKDWDRDLQKILQKHREVVRYVVPDAPDIEDLKVQDNSTGEYESYCRCVTRYLSEWKKDTKKKGLVGYVEKHFREQPVPVPARKKVNGSKKQKTLSARLTPETLTVFSEARSKYARENRKAHATETEVVVHALRFYVSSGKVSGK
jgi:hypothetical protein